MKITTKLSTGLAAVALLCIAAADARNDRHDDDSKWQRLVLDVALDGPTYTANRVDPAGVADVKGDWFVVRGKIYNGGTIPVGGTLEEPGSFDPATTGGQIGEWICRGVYIQDYASDIHPHVATTQNYLFGPEHSLASEGLEGGTVKRVVMGGTGNYRGFIGEVKEELLGFNATGFENVRFTFRIRKAD
jgi:hypothetical protein